MKFGSLCGRSGRARSRSSPRSGSCCSVLSTRCTNPAAIQRAVSQGVMATTAPNRVDRPRSFAPASSLDAGLDDVGRWRTVRQSGRSRKAWRLEAAETGCWPRTAAPARPSASGPGSSPRSRSSPVADQRERPRPAARPAYPASPSPGPRAARCCRVSRPSPRPPFSGVRGRSPWSRDRAAGQFRPRASGRR